jgi:hypothetical protein
MAFTNFLEFLIFLYSIFSLFLVHYLTILDLRSIIEMISVEILITCIFFRISTVFGLLCIDALLLYLVFDALFKLSRLLYFVYLILSALHILNY